MRWFFKIGRRRLVRRRRSLRRTKRSHEHYQKHKEEARSLTLARLNHFNKHYNLTWNRIAIRDTKTRWGSCSAKKNLNFNYRILFLPPHLQDYIIVHELCHLKHLNHSQDFWSLVAETVPNYKNNIKELKFLEKNRDFWGSVGY